MLLSIGQDIIGWWAETQCHQLLIWYCMSWWTSLKSLVSLNLTYHQRCLCAGWPTAYNRLNDNIDPDLWCKVRFTLRDYQPQFVVYVLAMKIVFAILDFTARPALDHCATLSISLSRNRNTFLLTDPKLCNSRLFHLSLCNMLTLVLSYSYPGLLLLILQTWNDFPSMYNCICWSLWMDT